jgi:hypothetical protein
MTDRETERQILEWTETTIKGNFRARAFIIHKRFMSLVPGLGKMMKSPCDEVSSLRVKD